MLLNLSTTFLILNKDILSIAFGHISFHLMNECCISKGDLHQSFHFKHLKLYITICYDHVRVLWCNPYILHYKTVTIQ